MAQYVMVVELNDLKTSIVKEATDKFQGTVSNGKLLVKIEDFNKQTDYILKRQNILKVGLADISNYRIDMVFSPSPIFSEKFDEMLRRISSEEIN